MNAQEYAEHMKAQFAFNGFTACPLSERELSALWLAGIEPDLAYGVGCDVAAGFDMGTALAANALADDLEEY